MVLGATLSLSGLELYSTSKPFDVYSTYLKSAGVRVWHAYNGLGLHLCDSGKESVFEVGIALRQSLSEMVVSMRLEEVAWSIL